MEEIVIIICAVLALVVYLAFDIFTTKLMLGEDKDVTFQKKLRHILKRSGENDKN